MKAFNAINKYRRAHWLYEHGFKLLSRLYELRIYQAHNSFIPASAQIGEGTVFGYKGIGVIVHKRAVIGKNCIIGTNVTIGGRSGHYEVPKIGDNVDISTGAKVLGPITVGDGCVIGANAVVIKDCPPHTVWGGGSCSMHQGGRGIRGAEARACGEREAALSPLTIIACRLGVAHGFNCLMTAGV